MNPILYCAVFSVDLECKEKLNLLLKYLTSSQGAVGFKLQSSITSYFPPEGPSAWHYIPLCPVIRLLNDK